MAIKRILAVLSVVLSVAVASRAQMAEEAADSLSAVYEPVPAAADAASDSVHAPLAVADSLAGRFAAYDVWEERTVVFNPDPTKAVWMSALFPGLGQVYNRRYWKLPIVVGAYRGLGYAT